MINIENGIYELTETVNNPRPDKRRKASARWYDEPTFIAGSRFVVESDETSRGTLPTLRAVGTTHYLPVRDERVAPMLFLLEGVSAEQLTIDEKVDLRGLTVNDPLELLRFMEQRGYLTAADVDAVLDEYEEHVSQRQPQPVQLELPFPEQDDEDAAQAAS